MLRRPARRSSPWVPLAILLWGVVGGRCDPALYTAAEVETFMAVRSRCPPLSDSQLCCPTRVTTGAHQRIFSHIAMTTSWI